MHRGPLPADEVAVVDGIPVTTIPRTLLDLAAVLPLRHVERAINEAEIRRLTDPFSLDALVARYPRRRGVATIKAILADARIGRTITRSDLEVEFQAFLDRYDLPRPEVNAAIEAGGRTLWVDCVWREQRVVVELDSRSIHDTAAAFESDRARDRALQAAGWRVVRVTARHLCREPDLLAADLRAMVTTG